MNRLVSTHPKTIDDSGSSRFRISMDFLHFDEEKNMDFFFRFSYLYIEVKSVKHRTPSPSHDATQALQALQAPPRLLRIARVALIRSRLRHLFQIFFQLHLAKGEMRESRGWWIYGGFMVDLCHKNKDFPLVIKPGNFHLPM
jgi:hypothetical protein